MNRAVHDTGPYDAPLLVIGEAGGKEEGAKGRPFVGVTGRRVRELIADAGLDPERQVRYANVIPVEMGALPNNPSAMQAIVRAHWNSIDASLLRGEHRAVLLYGRAALWRITGATKITDHCGEVAMIEVGGRMVPCVASIHPASVMRSKIEAGWRLVRAATERACRYASGAIEYDPSRMMPPWAKVYTAGPVILMHEAAVASGWPVAIDTEYDRVSKRPFTIGLSLDGEHVSSVVPLDDTISALRDMLDDARVVKVFHHAPADVAALATLGIDVRPTIYDTLMMYATLYPDLPVGLERVSLHLFDHWHSWKGMAHDDPGYNAIDVAATWRAFVMLSEEMTRAGLWPVYMREVRHVGVLAMAMEARGLAVDRVAQGEAVRANERTCAAIKAEVEGHVAGVFARRLVIPERQLALIEEELPTIVQPRLKKDRDPVVALRVETMQKARTKLRAVIERWSRGFDLGNNDHLRWLLYDADGFKLPVQRHEGRPTANADAIARLLALKRVQESAVIKSVLAGVKEYQHAMKMTGTFLNPWLDWQDIAHPEYRAFGTGTGRMAGGPDSDLGDRQVNAYSYNALNLPEETRLIYVPHRADFAVGAAAVATEVEDDDDSALGVEDL